LRVIAGSAKGARLRAPSFSGTRPISDRGKEGLFNILAPDLPGSTFLDLFAGTGGVGIEALSRGAASATFVEKAQSAITDLIFNLEKTRLRDRANIAAGDVFHFLLDEPQPFDIVFVAPPQWLGLWERAVTAIDQRPDWVAESGIVVTQHDPKENVEIATSNLTKYSTRTYGNVQFVFYERS
jgi:16S rRNA (guanine966-N2)-methyltransferase